MKNKNYPLYEVKRITTLTELVDYRAKESPDKIAFAWSQSGERYERTYKEFKEEINTLSTAIKIRDTTSKKIAILGENSYYWILSFFSIVCSSNVAVPIDKELPVENIILLIKNSGCSHLIFSDTYSDIAETICQSIEICAINMKDLPLIISKGKDITDNSIDDVSYINVSCDTLAAIIYTSGTTGISKGVMLSHGNLALDTYSACSNCKFFGDTLLLLPLHHSFGLVAGVFVTMIYGYTIYINSSLKNISKDLVLAKPQSLFLVPLFVETLYKNIWTTAAKNGKSRLLKLLLKVSNFLLKCRIDLRRKIFKSVINSFGGNLDTIISGGAQLNEQYIKGFREFGINLLNGYGITECSPVVAVNRNNYYKDGSVGQVLNECTVKIVSKDDNGIGEVCVKGSIVMQGYYNMKKATEDVLVDNWFHTGDIGYIDNEGFLFITGRKKNLIILSNGENVAPEELESLFDSASLVKEVVVYESNHKIIAEVYPDYQFAENSKIVSIKDALNNLLNDINKKLPKFKQISSVIIRDKEFEKTTTKKIKRNMIGGNK